MELCLGCDHAAYDAKKKLILRLKELDHNILDLGHDDRNSCHYPDYAFKVVQHIQREGGRGILLCGSGIGVSIVANRFAGIRAALCRTPKEAQLSRQHNDANVLCLGSRMSNEEEIWEMACTWLKTDFEGGRHQQRIDLFNDLGVKMS